MHDATGWRLTNRSGHELRLPGLLGVDSALVRIGVGHTFRGKAKQGRGRQQDPDRRAHVREPGLPGDHDRHAPRWDRRAKQLEPARIRDAHPVLGSAQVYDLIHLPIVAPSVALLEADRSHTLGGWKGFWERYKNELSAEAVAVAQAFVEAAAQRGSLVVLLCAEPYRAGFDQRLGAPGSSQPWSRIGTKSPQSRT